MKTKQQNGLASDKFRNQILCKTAPYRFNLIFKYSLNPIVLILCITILAGLMQRTLAPLRRIVARELVVLEYDRISTDRPQSFIVLDHLECGHEEACLSWDIFDLLNAYTTNPQVMAKRHRCKPCASLLADKKPVQPVRLAKAGAKKSPQFWEIA